MWLSGPAMMMPALLISTSMLPSCCCTAATMVRTSSALVRSCARASTSAAPYPARSWRARASSSGSRAQIATLAAFGHGLPGQNQAQATRAPRNEHYTAGQAIVAAAVYVEGGGQQAPRRWRRPPARNCEYQIS